jgi:hypothetical protein
MARARNIKPSFFTNEDLIELDFGARLLFIGLWTLCDREGRLEDRPKKIKMELFPADNIDVNEALDGLASFGFIKRYVADGKRVIQVMKFSEHQSPHGKEQDSELPNESGVYTKHIRSGNGHVTGKTENFSSSEVIESVKEKDMPKASPRHAQGKPTLNPESPFLNPDILIPESREYEREEIAVLTESENTTVPEPAFSQAENFNPANLPTTNRTRQSEAPTAIVSMEARRLTAKLHKDTAKRIAGFTPDATRWADETAIAKLLKAGATQADIETAWAFATNKPFWAGKIATPKDLAHNWVKLSQEAKATTAKQTPAQAQASKDGYPVLDREGWTAKAGEGWYTPWGTREGWHDGVFFENDCEMMGAAA